jgi:hypothetical protein
MNYIGINDGHHRTARLRRLLLLNYSWEQGIYGVWGFGFDYR